MYLPDCEIEFNALTPLLIAFAHAQDGLHAGRQHRTHLIDDIRIILRMVFAAFGMADDDIRTSKMRNHIRGDVAGECPLRRNGHRLRPITNLQVVGFH